MGKIPSTQRTTWFERAVSQRNWYFFACLAFYLAGSMVLRLVLIRAFAANEITAPAQYVYVLSIGLRCDIIAGMIMMFPLFLWLNLIPSQIFESRLHQFLLHTSVAVYLAAQSFMFVVEHQFFDEFNSRFNTVAVDYLVYPTEVFVNIWESYPVLKIIFFTFGTGLVVSKIFRHYYRRHPVTRTPLGRRLAGILAYGLLVTTAITLKDFEPNYFHDNRLVFEIAANGYESFVHAAVTHELNYPQFYLTLPRSEAYQRSRKLLAERGDTFSKEGDSIERRISNSPANKPRNLVILLIESFGSEFWGSLGRTEPTCTPEMDALSKEGILFTNLYACGNRTVRGMEGVLASFPPMPGDSIVKRSLSDRVATIARTLKARGFQTLFVYGGRGLFDGMRSFTTRNGFDRFIEQKDFPNPTFTTIWGVCDEDSFRRSIEEMRAMHATGKPFFVTVLSVSNHKPYTYPKGRIPENPDQHARPFAVKYTDWALGDFFRRVKKEPFYKDTLFAVVADHGARVYGSQQIPIKSYRIPLLLVGAGIDKAQRVDTVGGSLDVGPTLLDRLGITYNSVFFGQDMFKKDPAKAWAMVNHNRDIGMFRNGKLVVLSLNKTVETYRMDDATQDLKLFSNKDDNALRELQADTISLFQVADELYTQQRYTVENE